MRPSEDQVREELKKVIDPELFVNIVDLGLIYVVDIQELDGAAEPAVTEAASEAGEAAAVAADAPDAGGAEEQVKVKIEMTMTSPMCPAGPQLVAQSKQVVQQIAGVADCEVKVVMDPPWTPDRMTDDARDQLGIF